MQPNRVHLGPRLLRLVLLGLLLLAAALLHLTRRLDADNRAALPLPPLARYSASAVLPTEATPLLARSRVPAEFTLLRGETITQVFERLGLGGADARQATDALAAHANVRALRAGNRYSAFFNSDSSLASVAITLDGSGRLELARSGRRWESVWQPFQRSVEVRAISGEVDGSLETSIRRAGGPVALAYRVADVLKWDLDFNRDLHRGDRFEALYEELRVNGQTSAIGDVYAVAYQDASERRHEAYRFQGGDTYYDGDGQPLRKMFLRSPLRYSHITSSFSMHRFHPVLNVVRPHYGVDYGAAVGTPVQVTANGVVSFTGWDGGGGNVVKVRHGEQYETCYLHLSRFGAGIRPGAHVRQGEIIAYTGMTGLATGPHLDYRVKHYGQWIDPLSLHGVRDEAIPSYQLASFRSWRDEIRTSMESGRVTAALRSRVAPMAPSTTERAIGGARERSLAGVLAR
jgi:murein DD-endopeptidase MepM/ murein hydrolase activator NlpD